MTDIRKNLEELKPLDLNKVHTIGELVSAMSHCSFGARMLGEAVRTIFRWIDSDSHPYIVYEGDQNCHLYHRLEEMVNEIGYFTSVVTIDDYICRCQGEKVLVVGNYSEKYAKLFYSQIDEAIFINPWGQVKPGQIRDGYFPGFVPSDPNLIIPIIRAALDEKYENKKLSITDFINGLSGLDGLAVEVSRGANTLVSALTDPVATICLTLSGAMTIAKMGLLVCDLIERGFVDYISTTGALMAHGLIESTGLKHYKYDPKHNDAELAAAEINRVTDTLEPEENFDNLEEVLKDVLSGLSGDEIASSDFHRKIGKYLVEEFPQHRGILASAYMYDIPVCVTAFSDSEIGNDVFVENMYRKLKSRLPIKINSALDTEILLRIATNARTLGIFSIGGGVPRNNTQNVAPLIEIINKRLNLKLPPGIFFYGCRIDPTPMWYGNLSGCTYSEGGSWRKFATNGIFSEVHADATIVWPIMQKFVTENVEKRIRRRTVY